MMGAPHTDALDARKLAELLGEAGARPTELGSGRVSLTAAQLAAFAAAVVERCALDQEARSSARHGYDKHGDGEAIRRVLDAEPASTMATMAPEATLAS